MTASFQIPDTLLQKADQLAEERGVSRNEIVVHALEQYLGGEENGERIVAQLNVVYENETSALDSDLAKIQTHSLSKESW